MAGRRRNHPLPHGERRFRAVFAALGVLAVAAVLFGTRRGIGLANDSVNYLRAARGVLDGRGLIVMQAFHYAGPVPMTHWPPLYPLLLAASGELGLDMEAFARGLHALLLAANVLLIGRFAFDRGLGLAASVAAALLFATNREVLYVHQMVWTEPLFLFTILLGFTLLARHLEAPRRALVWSAGACAALAVMTRYVGVAAVAAGALGLMLFARGPRSARARDALRFAAPACVVLSLWALHNAWVGRAPSWGELELRLPRASPLLRPLSEVVRDWLWPFSSALPVAGARIAAPTAAAIPGPCCSSCSTRSAISRSCTERCSSSSTPSCRERATSCPPWWHCFSHSSVSRRGWPPARVRSSSR